MPDIESKIDNFLGRIDKMHESFHEHVLADTQNFTEIKATLKEMVTALKEHQVDMKEYMDKTEPRIRSLEDFQIRFVAKFSVWSAIAITVGSVVGQLALSLLNNIVFK